MIAIERWINDDTARAALTSLNDTNAIVETAIAIQQIPAPTFDEGLRASDVAARMRAIGLVDVHIDAISNAYGRVPGRNNGPKLLIAAHLDTVFPAATDLTIRREGSRIYGPGLGDNSLGVAGLLHLARALIQHNTPNEGDIWCVANVGEEGLGDLRGMREAVNQLPGIHAAIALEGGGIGRIVHAGIGVRRYRIVARTAGGHSWLDFGSPSAIHALVQLASKLTGMATSSNPKSTFNIGVIEGGTSVNTIAQHAALLLDLRAEQPAELASLIEQTSRLLAEVRASDPRIALEAEIVGDRPSGSIPTDHPLVQTTAAAYASQGIEVSYESASTDANIPLSRQIPSVCFGIGDSENAHRTDEYIETGRISAGLRALLLLALAATAT